MKMTKFHNIAVKTYPHKSLNVSKGIVRSRELSLCTNVMKKQEVIEVKRIYIKKVEKTIETNTYVMKFNQPKKLK